MLPVFLYWIVGDCNIEEPPAWEVSRKIGYHAWMKKKGMSADECKAEYIKLADHIYKVYETS